MNEDDFKRLKKGTTLYSAALDLDHDKILISTWTLVGVTHQSFHLRDQYGIEVKGRLWNYADTVQKVHLTKEAAVDQLTEVCRLNVTRAEERLKTKQTELQQVEYLAKDGTAGVVTLKARTMPGVRFVLSLSPKKRVRR